MLRGGLVWRAAGVTSQGGDCSTRRSVLETFLGIGGDAAARQKR